MRTVSMLINGEQVSAKDTFESTNPYTGQAWAEIPNASQQDVDDAFGAADDTFRRVWRRTSGVQRAQHMERLAAAIDERHDEMARLETTDNGKVIRETLNQMTFASRNLRFFAGYADKLYGRTIPLDNAGVMDFTTRHPYGTAVLVTPWNSPISILMNKLPAALATGNTVVIKPSEHTSVTTCELGRLATEAGLPPGVINIVTGAGDVGDMVTRHPLAKKISFTGGSATGTRVAENASKHVVPVTLELGGKSPNIIFADADLDRAVPGAVAGIFGATGQTCIAGSRLLVQKDVYSEVVEGVVRRARAIKLGDPLDPGTEMGPLANNVQYDKVLGLIETANSEGAVVATGGAPPRDRGLENGFFVEPTVLRDATPDMTIVQQEVFGPVLTIIPFDHEEEAIEIANNSEYGLAAGVWTNDLSRAHRVVNELECGIVWVNTYRASAAQGPIGGVKMSGYGRERGEECLSEYTYVKNVMIDYSAGSRDPFSIRF